MPTPKEDLVDIILTQLVRVILIGTILVATACALGIPVKTAVLVLLGSLLWNIATRVVR